MLKKKAEVDLYLIVNEGDVEPVVHGPYKDLETRDKAALKFRKDDPNMENGIFMLQVSKGAKVEIDTYSGGFFDQDEE